MFLTGLVLLIGVLILLLGSLNKPCTLYLAQPMTGFDKQEMIQLAKQACFIAKSYGLSPWSPVLEEGVSGRGKLKADKTLTEKWNMDKVALNHSFCFVNLRADEKSFGCENEYGRHRYTFWRPSFLISPKHAEGYRSIANYQADGIFADMHTCFRYIANNYGTPRQRWRFLISMWISKGPMWVFRQIQGLFI